MRSKPLVRALHYSGTPILPGEMSVVSGVGSANPDDHDQTQMVNLNPVLKFRSPRESIGLTFPEKVDNDTRKKR